MIGFVVFIMVSIFGVFTVIFIDKLICKYSKSLNDVRSYFDKTNVREMVNNILKYADTTGYNNEDDFIDDMIFRLIDVIHLKMINENYKVSYTDVEVVVFEKLYYHENYFIEDEFMKFFYKDNNK